MSVVGLLLSVNDPRLFVLESFGLSGYLARAYVALLDLGPSQARDIAERSQVPQGRIYDVLEKLHARGLIELLPEAPKRYRALPFETFIDRELSFHQERAVLLERQRDDILQTMQPKEEQRAEPVEYLVVRGRRAVQERVAALIDASQDVLILGTEATGLRVGQYEEAVRRAAQRGATVRLVLPVTKTNRAAIEEAVSWGARVRHRETTSALAISVFDGTRALLHRGPAEPGKGQDATAILLEAPELAQGLRDMGEQMWFRAVDLGPRIAELDTGRPAGAVQVFRRLPEAAAALRQAVSGAQRDVRLSLPADVLPAALPGWEDAVRGLVARKARVRVLLGAGPAAAGVAASPPALAEALARLGAEVRVAADGPLACAIVDQEQGFLGLPALLRLGAAGPSGSWQVLWSDGVEFVGALGEQFEEGWAEGAARRPAEPRRLPPS